MNSCVDKDKFPALHRWMSAMEKQECTKIVALQLIEAIESKYIGNTLYLDNLEQKTY